MTNLTKLQIEKLMEGATKLTRSESNNHEKFIHELLLNTIPLCQTALDLYARVEEMEKELKDSRDIAQVWCDRCYALGYDPMKTP